MSENPNLASGASLPGVQRRATPPPPTPSTPPLWQIRLVLAWQAFQRNVSLFAENKIGLVGLIIIGLFAMLALAHPVLLNTVWDDRTYNPVTGFDATIVFHPAPPSAKHLLGTDPFGRDILSQLMFGTSSAFVLGVVAALVTVVLATSVGAVAAFYGGLVDSLLMRLVDLVIMSPFITILIVLATMFDLTMLQLALVIGILGGFGATAVIIKSQALSIKVRTYIEAARVAGGSNTHIILTHIIPNLLPLSFLYMMFSVTGAIFSEGVLSFFGLLNVRMSWGLMINTASTSGYLLDFEKWWLIFPASLSITSLCAAFYLVGRALDEVVNPRLRER